MTGKVDATAIELLVVADEIYHRKKQDIIIRRTNSAWMVILPNYESGFSAGLGKGKTILAALQATIKEREKHKAYLQERGIRE